LFLWPDLQGDRAPKNARESSNLLIKFYKIIVSAKCQLTARSNSLRMPFHKQVSEDLLLLQPHLLSLGHEEQ
jgi:hypothetical protein